MTKTKKRVLLAAVLLLAIGAGGFFYYQYGMNPDENEALAEALERMPEDVKMATGTTGTGRREIELDLDYLDTKLVVETVYVSSFDEVKEGDPILKITDRSMTEAVRELERAKMDARLSYRQGMIDYEEGKLEASSAFEDARILAENAETEKENAIALAKVSLDKAQYAVENQQEIVDEYTDAIENGFYYKDYRVEESKALYEKNMAVFFDKLEDYGYELDDEEPDENGLHDDDPNTFRIVEKKEKGKSVAQKNDGESTVLQLLKTKYQSEKDKYEDALDRADNDTAKAIAGIDAANDRLQILQLKWEQEKIDYAKAEAEANAQYDETIIKSKKAKDTYQTKIKSLEEALQLLQDDEEEAAENLEYFQTMFQDGYVLAETSGTIMMVSAIKGNTLSDGVLLAYSDSEKMVVNASVDQSVIADVAIDDKATILLEEKEPMEGIVTAINPVSSSNSRASVTYRVTVELTKDSDEVTPNLTATVIFGELKEMKLPKNNEAGMKP